MTSRQHQSLQIEKKAWFLCKFLCRELSEYNFEKVRDHVAVCKGTKTRVKLSAKGWRIGSKLRLNSKLPHQFFPLPYIDDIRQDIVFVNVLMCILKLEDTVDGLGQQFEIIAFKFQDQGIVKRFQDIFQILIGSESPGVTTFAKTQGSIGNLTLVPSKAYHMGTLAPEKWGTPDRAGSTIGVSEASYGSRNYNGGGRAAAVYSASHPLPYGAIVPANAVQRRSYTAYSDRLASGTDDGNDVVSFGSSEPGGYREVAVMANLGNPGPSNAIPILHYQRYRSYSTPDGITKAEIGCQVDVNAVGARTNGWHQPTNGRAYLHSEGSVLSDNSSVIFEDTTSPYSNHNGGRGAALASVDVVDGSASVRRVYSRGISERSRNDGQAIVGQNGLNHYPQESTNMLSRSRSVDLLKGNRYQLQTVSRQDLYSDSMSMRSQSSYLLDPKFRKVYSKRNAAPTSQVYRQPVIYQDNYYRR